MPLPLSTRFFRSAIVASTLFVGSSMVAQPRSPLNVGEPPKAAPSPAKAFSEASVEVSKTVTPTVVSITVPMSKLNDQRLTYLQDYLKQFGHSFDADKYRSHSIGSGVLITRDGYILTNHHVVENVVEDSILVTLTDGNSYYANLIGQDPITDLALLKIYGKDFPYAFFGNTNDASVGQWVFAVGNPFGLRSTVTGGIISALDRGEITSEKKDEEYRIRYYLQIDAAVNPGNSGGGLFDLDGRLIGINSAIYSRSGTFEGYALAIPADIARSVAEDLMDGKIDRGVLGIGASNVEEKIARKQKYTSNYGAIVDDVDKGSAADMGDIKAKDIIISINKRPIKTVTDLQHVLALYQANSSLAITVWRDGKELTKNVTLQPGSEDKLAWRREPRVGSLGVNVTPVDNATIQKVGLTASGEGLRIESLSDFGAAAKAGLDIDDIILKANGTPINSSKDLEVILSSTKPGDTIDLTVWKDKSQQTIKVMLHSRIK